MKPAIAATIVLLALAAVAGVSAVTREHAKSTPTTTPTGTAVAAGSAITPATANTPTLTKTDAEWRKILTPKEYAILVKSDTERAFTGEFWDHHEKGVYVSAASGVPLFSSEDKFDSGTGWPSFTRPITPGSVREVPDTSFGVTQIEIEDAATGFHLGHVFEDGPAPTGRRYCINSAALRFVPAGEK